ncbi:ATP-dependent DNA helicase PIF1 [Trifolium pratense]|uniref:ATP-dependent DNA helicase PIF1 n=1 Tax=Trifolium pratense TaxID=57577 RepID=A0A2K3MNZ2_TRIPR|nr:ATP-dependent DNA helicase PIF1 [Trifolium pratense]
MFDGVRSITQDSCLSYSNLENVQPMVNNENNNITSSTTVTKRTLERIPLSYSNIGNVRAMDVSQNNHAMFDGMRSMTQDSCLSYSNLENVQPMVNNENYNITSSTTITKRKADRIPLSPLNPASILTPNIFQDLNLTIQSKRARTPNPKYFSPTSCFINTLNSDTEISSNSRQWSEYQKGTNSSRVGKENNSASSGVINPTSKSRGQLFSKKKLKNKYIGVGRLDFEDDIQDSPDAARKLDDIKSKLYATSETEPIINFGLPEFTCPKCAAELWYEERSRNYKENLRAYNSMFAFTSMGGQIEDKYNNGGGPPQFILGGQNYHRIGSLLPEAGTTPKFAQLSDNKNKSKQEPIDLSLIKDLQDMIHSYNPLAKAYRKVKDALESSSFKDSQLSLRLYRHREKDSRMHNIPTADEVAGLIIGDFDDSNIGRDIIVNEREFGLTRIHETHVLFLPMQYPLLFPRGENGWEPDIKRFDAGELTNKKKRERVTIREFIAFRLQERNMEFGNILSSKRLFQQFVVDCYTMLEAQRLSFIRENQSKIRQDVLSGIQEAVERGDLDASLVGKRIIVPDSFTGGPRYMFNNCQDAMGICKKFGYPDLFITVTCNANWPEIRDFIQPKGLQPSDRPDIVCRVFKMKLDQMMFDFKKDEIFGKGCILLNSKKEDFHTHICYCG